MHHGMKEFLFKNIFLVIFKVVVRLVPGVNLLKKTKKSRRKNCAILVSYPWVPQTLVMPLVNSIRFRDSKLKFVQKHSLSSSEN